MFIEFMTFFRNLPFILGFRLVIIIKGDLVVVGIFSLIL